jgi:methyl-accepting chemotaxis protein
MIEETSRNAEQSAKVAEHMRELSVELNSTVGQFKA